MSVSIASTNKLSESWIPGRIRRSAASNTDFLTHISQGRDVLLAAGSQFAERYHATKMAVQLVGEVERQPSERSVGNSR